MQIAILKDKTCNIFPNQGVTNHKYYKLMIFQVQQQDNRREKFKQAEKEKMRYKTWKFHSETEICTFTIDRLIKTTSTTMTCRLVFELDNDGAILKCWGD